MTKAKSHLLKHEVPESVDSVFHFGTDDKKEIARLVAAMGQRQLQVSPQRCPPGFGIARQPPCEREGVARRQRHSEGGVSTDGDESVWLECGLLRAGKVHDGLPEDNRLQ